MPINSENTRRMTQVRTRQGTRKKILRAGAEIVHQKGFNNTGIQEILKSAGVPKGSFYFYFDNKEDFGLHLIDFFSDFFFFRCDEYLKDASMPPIERLRAFFQEFLVYFEENEFKGG